MKPSYITIEVPLEHGGSLSMRSDYQYFLKKGLETLKNVQGAPPMADAMAIKLIDAVILACAKGAATEPETWKKEKEEEKEDRW